MKSLITILVMLIVSCSSTALKNLISSNTKGELKQQIIQYPTIYHSSCEEKFANIHGHNAKWKYYWTQNICEAVYLSNLVIVYYTEGRYENVQYQARNLYKNDFSVKIELANKKVCGCNENVIMDNDYSKAIYNVTLKLTELDNLEPNNLLVQNEIPINKLGRFISINSIRIFGMDDPIISKFDRDKNPLSTIERRLLRKRTAEKPAVYDYVIMNVGLKLN